MNGAPIPKNPVKRKNKRFKGISAVSSNPANVAAKKNRKKLKADLWRSYGLERPSKPRYTGRKGIYWFLFSIKVRVRDWKKYNGECVDQCGKRAYDWHEFDAGHFAAAGGSGFALLFHEQNVNGQLKGCNNPLYSPNSNIGYGFGVDKRYGEGTAKKLWDMRKLQTKEWSQKEYDTKIIELLPEVLPYIPSHLIYEER